MDRFELERITRDAEQGEEKEILRVTETLSCEERINLLKEIVALNQQHKKEQPFENIPSLFINCSPERRGAQDDTATINPHRYIVLNLP